MEFISPFRLAPGRLRASGGKRQPALEVDGGAQQLQMAGVAAEPDVADAAEAVTAFHDPEAALDGGPAPGQYAPSRADRNAKRRARRPAEASGYRSGGEAPAYPYCYRSTGEALALVAVGQLIRG